MHEKKTPVPPNAGIEIQSFVGMLNFCQLVSEFIKTNLEKTIGAF